MNHQGLQDLNRLLGTLSSVMHHVNHIMNQFLNAVATAYHVLSGGGGGPGGWGWGWGWGYYGGYSPRFGEATRQSFLVQILVVGLAVGIAYLAYTKVWPWLRGRGGDSGSSRSAPRPRSSFVRSSPSGVDEEGVHPRKFEAKEYSTNCAVCDAAFGLMRWKQHCHHCGRVVCSGCAAARLKVPPYFTTKAVPVCDDCCQSRGGLTARRPRGGAAEESKDAREASTDSTWHAPSAEASPSSASNDVDRAVLAAARERQRAAAAAQTMRFRAAAAK